MSDRPEIVVWNGEMQNDRVEEGHHTFVLGYDESLPICGYTTFDYDRVCINRPRHAGEPHFQITGQAQNRYPGLRVMEVICHD